jgi:hypothetical protein
MCRAGSHRTYNEIYSRARASATIVAAAACSGDNCRPTLVSLFCGLIASDVITHSAHPTGPQPGVSGRKHRSLHSPVLGGRQQPGCHLGCAPVSTVPDGFLDRGAGMWLINIESVGVGRGRPGGSRPTVGPRATWRGCGSYVLRW